MDINNNVNVFILKPLFTSYITSLHSPPESQVFEILLLTFKGLDFNCTR